ncbi:hypothetical protein E2C01_064073 [Portunus trituberculatus]|uniref:Uncharacterized protein n=1 Tax=Portunus trituberculatus TaxID=210409 RepID=A0A5B7HFB1_PORTR|nr:hypothetical protein [Portunus trituberculatus]
MFLTGYYWAGSQSLSVPLRRDPPDGRGVIGCVIRARTHALRRPSLLYGPKIRRRGRRRGNSLRAVSQCSNAHAQTKGGRTTHPGGGFDPG